MLVLNWGMSIKKHIILLALLPLIGGCAFIDKALDSYVEDNIAEEIIEEIIEAKTGLDIDLTPGSPES